MITTVLDIGHFPCFGRQHAEIETDDQLKAEADTILDGAGVEMPGN